MSERPPQIPEVEENIIESGDVDARKQATETATYYTNLIEGKNLTAEFLHQVRDELQDEFFIVTEAGQAEAVQILEAALKSVQTKLEVADPKERFVKIIEAKIAEAEQLLAAGKGVSAVGTLYSMLVDRRLAKYLTNDQRAQYVTLMNEVKAREGLPIDPNFKGYPEGYKGKYH